MFHHVMNSGYSTLYILKLSYLKLKKKQNFYNINFFFRFASIVTFYYNCIHTVSYNNKYTT